MKKVSNRHILILSLLLSTNLTVAFATCPVNEETTSCSIAEFSQREFEPIFPTGPAFDLDDTPETRLKPYKNPVQEASRDFSPKPADYNYNTNCQFGVCNTGGIDPLFLNR